MTAAVDDEVLHEFAAVGTPEEAADILAARYTDVFDRFTLVTPYDLDETARARVAARLRELT